MSIEGVVGLLVILAIISYFSYRKRQQQAAIRARGWELINNPDASVVTGLNNSPFGIGTDRTVTRFISGRSRNGTPFRAFKYRCAVMPLKYWSSQGNLIIAMQLDKSLPEFYIVNPERPLPNVEGQVISKVPGVRLDVAPNPDFGELLCATIDPEVSELLAKTPISLVIDHNQLVILYCPNKLEVLDYFLSVAERMASKINQSPQLNSFDGPTPPTRLSFHNHPDWGFLERDDSFLSEVEHVTSGFDHRARNIKFQDSGPLHFIGLTHTYKTSSTDSEGHDRTTTHTEEILEFQPQFPYVPFSVNRKTSLFEQSKHGKIIQFEYADFNKKYKIRCINPKFAMDVFHPRTIEYVMHAAPPPFSCSKNMVIKFELDSNTEDVVGWCEDFLIGFFRWTPDFVWEDLGINHNPFETY